MQDRFVRLIAEADILKLNVAANLADGHCPLRVAEFVHLAHDLNGAVESGDGLGQLCADVHNLEYRSNHEGEKHIVLKVVAERKAMGEVIASPQKHDQAAHNAQNSCGCK